MGEFIQLSALFLIFIFFAIWVFYILGYGLIGSRSPVLEKQEILIFSFASGVVLFVLLAVVLGLLQLRMLSLPILAVAGLLVVFKYRKKLLSPWSIFLKDKLLLLLIMSGILTQGFINFPSGFLYKEGLLFWSSQGHDGLWHVALIEEIKKSFPPQNPIFAGEGLYNYHFLVDILMGEFARIFSFFSSLDLYFRFFPVVLSFMIGMSVFSFVSRWQNNKKIGYLAMFFTYFTGSFGYVVTFMKQGSIFGGETVFWAAQGNTILGNPPHAISYSLVPTFFLALLFFTKKRSKFWFIITFLLASILGGFKVSGGLVVLVGLSVATAVEVLFKRKLSLLLLTVCLGLSNFLTVKTMTRGAASFLMFLPWWFVRTMVVAGNRLDWIDLENQRQHYLSKGTWHAYLRVTQVEATAFLIFLIGNMGTRAIGFIEVSRRMISGKLEFLQNPLEIALIVAMVTGFVVPMLFVQRGIIYNNIQFMQYFLLIFGFYAAITVYKMLAHFKNRAVQVIIFVLIFVFSVPTVIGNLVEFYGPKTSPLAVVSNGELQALDFLKRQSLPSDVILNVPFNKYLKDQYHFQPKPIYAWYSTPFIPAIASRRTYLSAEEQALITDYPFQERRDKMEKFFKQEDYSWNRQFLNDANIKYIYTSKDELDKPLDLINNNLSQIFENNEVVIYRVNYMK